MYEYEPDYLNNLAEPQRYHSTEGMPDKPISPTKLSKTVVKKLEKYVIVPDKTALMIEGMCKAFNECIRLNQPIKEKGSVPFPGASKEKPQDKYLPTKTLVCSPRTGSAKSLTSKVYVSLLKKESSILIVSTIDEAIEFCKDINKWSGDENYARCYYSIVRETGNKFLVSKKDLKNYRCIVITHAMFISANQDIYSISANYHGKRRDLTIIDERLSLYNQTVIKNDEVEFLCNVVDSMKKHTKVNLKGLIAELNKAKELFKTLTVYTIRDKTNHHFVSTENSLPVPDLDYELLEALIYSRTMPISRIINACNPKETQTNQRDNLKEKFANLSNVLEKSYVFYREGVYSGIIRIDEIYSKFGSSVVLDATANINAIYNTKVWHQEDLIMHLDIVDPRVYGNFTINKAVGYPQGASSIYKNLSYEESTSMINSIAKTVEKILVKDDKLLIITFKDFSKELQEAITSEQVVFTHWGNHIGKNIWSDCNKVMIIGWNHKPKFVDYCNFISSVGSTWSASNVIKDGKIIKDFHITAIADDIVQAISRCAVRKTISTDGNCQLSEAYLFYPDDKDGSRIMSIVEDQFKNAVIKDWNPIDMSKNQKKRQSRKNADYICDYVCDSLEEVDAIKESDVVKYFQSATPSISKSALSRTVNTLEFLEQLKERACERYMHNAKSYSYRKCK